MNEIINTEYTAEVHSTDENGWFEFILTKDEGMCQFQLKSSCGNDEAFINVDAKELTAIKEIIDKQLEIMGGNLILKKKCEELKLKLSFYVKLCRKVEKMLNAELEIDDYYTEIWNKVQSFTNQLESTMIELDCPDSEWDEIEWTV